MQVNRRWGTLGALSLALAACSGDVVDGASGMMNSSVPSTGLAAPSRMTFAPVDDMLQATCGTLDCHGQIGRNLRLYGTRGLRLSDKDNSAENKTTPAEYDQSYWSVIGLEPEILSDVVHDHGKDPERLSMVRKARGLERHKGNKLFDPGDAGDTCLISWLAGTVNTDKCKEVTDRERPTAPDPAPSAAK